MPFNLTISTYQLVIMVVHPLLLWMALQFVDLEGKFQQTKLIQVGRNVCGWILSLKLEQLLPKVTKWVIPSKSTMLKTIFLVIHF